MDNITYNSLHDYLDAIMADKETECVEFKHGKGGFPACLVLMLQVMLQVTLQVKQWSTDSNKYEIINQY